MYQDKKFKVNPDWCVGCMLCATVCPVSAIVMTETEPEKKFIYHPDEKHWKHE